METFNNTTKVVKDDLTKVIQPGSKVSIAAACFSIYAYQENSPELIYFMTLYNIFSEFIKDISENALPNEATGFKDSIIWNKHVLDLINWGNYSLSPMWIGCMWRTA